LRISDLAFVSFIVVICTLYALGPLNPNMCLVSSYILMWAVSGIVTPFSVLYLLKRWRLHERMKQLTIISLALGFFLWLQAEIVYAFYIFVLEVELPNPSVGDVFYIAGQFLIGVAFYSIMKWTGYFRKTRLRILNVLVGLGLGLLVLQMVIMPIVTDIKEISLGTVASVTYPIIDVVLFSLVFASFIALFRTYLWTIWALIPCGFMLILIADIGLPILVRNGAYFFGHPIEAVWLIGEVVVAYGCFRIASLSIDLRTFLQRAGTSTVDGAR
jgi:hypothetical protein